MQVLQAAQADGSKAGPVKKAGLRGFNIEK